jgi:hypothetical protein
MTYPSYEEQKALEELIADYRDFGDNPLGPHFWEIAKKYKLLNAETANIRAELIKRGF